MEPVYSPACTACSMLTSGSAYQQSPSSTFIALMPRAMRKKPTCVGCKGEGVIRKKWWMRQIARRKHDVEEADLRWVPRGSKTVIRSAKRKGDAEIS